MRKYLCLFMLLLAITPAFGAWVEIYPWGFRLNSYGRVVLYNLQTQDTIDVSDVLLATNSIYSSTATNWTGSTSLSNALATAINSKLDTNGVAVTSIYATNAEYAAIATNWTGEAALSNALAVTGVTTNLLLLDSTTNAVTLVFTNGVLKEVVTP